MSPSPPTIFSQIPHPQRFLPRRSRSAVVLEQTEGPGPFTDFFDKIESYIAIISGPAIQKCNANPYTFRVVEQAAPDSIFRFHDTLTSRAEITDLVRRFKQDVIAVIGLGGSYSRYAALMLDTNKARIFVFGAKPSAHRRRKAPPHFERRMAAGALLAPCRQLPYTSHH